MGYEPGAPTPLVLNFHGFGASALEQERYSEYPDAADKYGFIVVSPQATASRRSGTSTAPSKPSYVDDFAFTSRLIDELSATLCIDAARVYATGISNGGGMTSLVGCELSDRIAAIAPVAGEPYAELRCAGKGPMPVIAFHGTDDPLVPFEAGPGRRPPRPASGSARATTWRTGREHNGCDPTLKTERIADDVVLESYGGCKDGADVQLYVVEGGGHTWPGARSTSRGWAYTTHSIDATELVVAVLRGAPQASPDPCNELVTLQYSARRLAAIAMEARMLNQWWRLGGVFGILFLVLFIVGAMYQGETPTYGDPVDEIRAYFVDDGQTYLVGDFIIGLAFILFFFPFLSALRSVLGVAEGGVQIWSRLVLAGGLLFMALAAAGGATWTTLAFGDFAKNASDETIILIMGISTGADHFVPAGLAIMALSAGVATLRTGGLPAWHGGLSLIYGVLATVGMLSILADNPDESALGFLPWLGAGIWVLVTSIVLLMKKETPVAAAA